MRIALFTDTYLPTIDGVVNSVISIKKGLVERGHQVMVFAPESENCPPEENTVYCKARRFKPYPGYNLASMLPREFKTLKEFDPDVIHTHGLGGMAMKALWLSKDLGIRMVLTFHTMVTDVVGQYSPLNLRTEFQTMLLKLYLRTLIQRCDTVIVPSASVLSEIRQMAPRMKRVEVVPTGVDCGRFRPGMECSGMKKRWGLEENDIVLSVGRMAREKKLDVVLKAMPLVRRGHPGAKLLVVGDGPALPEYRKLSRSLGLEGYVIFAGFAEDSELPSYYGCCDAFVTASKFETQGLVILEALASGKPVVGARYRAIPEYVVEDETGYLFEPDSVTSCAVAIEKGLEAPYAIREGARRFAEERSEDASLDRLIKIYEGAASRGKRRKK